MRPDDLRSVMHETTPAAPSGNIGVKLDQLGSHISMLDALISTLFARLDPALLPNDPKGLDEMGPEPTKEMSHAARYIDEQIDRLVSMEAAVSALTRRVDL